VPFNDDDRTTRAVAAGWFADAIAIAHDQEALRRRQVEIDASKTGQGAEGLDTEGIID